MVEKSSKSSKTSKSKVKSSLIWSFLKLLLNQSYLVVVICIFIALVPLKDFPFNSKSFEVPNFQKVLSEFLEKSTKLVYKLDDPKFTRKLFFGYPGPEALAYDAKSSSFFISLADGRIMTIDEKFTKIELFARLSANATAEKCDGKILNSEECGRPLGLEVYQNNLYVVDAVFGLYSVNLQTKKSYHIPIQAYLAHILAQVLDKETFNNNLLYNDIRFDPVKPNLCYITISSTRYKMNQLSFSILEHENSGLLLAVDLEHKNGTIIGKDLYFANGVEISSDKQYLYVSETTSYSVLKLNLKQFRHSVYSNNNENQPKLESFLNDLLGEPDNLHTHKGKIYVGFSMVRLNGLTISDYLSTLPVIRNFVAKSFNILSKVIYFIRQMVLENRLNYKSDFLKELEWQFYSGAVVYSVIQAKGGIGVYEESTGKLTELIASNKFGFISQAFVHPKTDEIIFGSFRNDFIGVIKPN